MGKSIYHQLVEGKFDVDHEGETLTNVPLPTWLGEMGEVLAKNMERADEEAALTDVLITHNLLSEFYSLAFQQSLVNLREITRPKKGMSIILDSEKARERAHSHKPTLLRRPKVALTPEQELKKSIEALIGKGMTQEDIIKIAGLK